MSCETASPLPPWQSAAAEGWCRWPRNDDVSALLEICLVFLDEDTESIQKSILFYGKLIMLAKVFTVNISISRSCSVCCRVRANKERPAAQKK